jgi:protein-disulfide isomerase
MSRTTVPLARNRRSAISIAMQRQRRHRIVVNATIVFVCALLVAAGGWWYAAGRETSPSWSAYDGITMNGTVLGNPDVEHTLVEYGDYQCIHCADFALNAQPQFIKDFVETGKLRYEFRTMPVLGGDVADPANRSVRAAEASMCALDQGKFWEFHDRAFEPALNHKQDQLTDDFFIQIAGDLGMDRETFASCLSAGTHRQEVLDSYNEGMTLGLAGVPAFFLDGQAVLWPATGYEGFKSNLELALR